MTALTLRPVGPGDLDELYRWATTPGFGDHWRFLDRAPSRELFDIDLWRGVLRHRMICSSADGSPVGLATAYDANLRNGTVWLAIMASPACAGTGLAVLGAGLFIDTLFAEWPFRMVRIEAFAPSFTRFASLQRYAHVDGTLRQDRWANGRYHDLMLLSITREAWREHKAGTFGAALRRVSGPPSGGGRPEVRIANPPRRHA